MKRIDFLGAPGVGKTTLFNELLKQRGHCGKKWMTPQESKILIAKQYVRSDLWSLKEFIRFLILQFANPVVQKKLTENIYKSLADKAFKEKLEEWMPFIELCGKSLGDTGKPSYYRFLLAKWLLSQLEDVALIELNNFNKQVIFEESLSQKAVGLMPWDYILGEKQSIEFYNLMPPPGAVVLLRADPEKVTERLMNRKSEKLIVQHRGLSYHDLLERTKIATLIIKTGAETLNKRGIPILDLDGLLPVQELLQKTFNFIKYG